MTPALVMYEIMVPSLLPGIEIIQRACRIFSEAIDPIGTKCLAAGDGLAAGAAAMHHGIFGIKFQNRVDISRAIGIKPVDRNGHGIKGHIFHSHASKSGSGSGTAAPPMILIFHPATAICRRT